MNKQQFIECVLVPTLSEMPNGYSPKSELAILMIIAHESARGQYLTQTGNGPARGIIQMEVWVHDDVWDNGDSIWDNALDLEIISDEQYQMRKHPHSSRLVYDLRYNVFMARQRLFMDSNPLPSTPVEMSKYLKSFWNSNAGAASDTSYLEDYNLW